jgi:hypothetical protein
VIGKGGKNIKSINWASGAFVQIDQHAPPNASEKAFIIYGQPDNVEIAKQMVLRKVRKMENQLGCAVFATFFYCFKANLSKYGSYSRVSVNSQTPFLASFSSW